MKIKNRFILLLIVFVFLFAVVGCVDKPAELTEEQKRQQLALDGFSSLDLISFKTGDSQNNVTQDITLVTSHESYPIVWTSENNEVVTIQDGVAVISRQDKDTQVKITATFMVTSSLFEERTFTLLVKKTEYVSVTLDLNNGSLTGNNNLVFQVEKGKTFSYNQTPVKEGCTFTKWTLNGVEYDFSKPVTQNITLVAQYEINQSTHATITLSLNGGGLPMGVPLTYEVLVGEVFEGPSGNPSKGRYRFDAWYLDGEPYDFTKPVTKNITLVAQYIEQVIVTINLNGGTLEGVTSTTRVDKGTALQDLGTPTKPYSNFINWLSNGEPYDFNQVVNEDITIEANFEFVPALVMEEIKTRLLAKYDNKNYSQKSLLNLINGYSEFSDFNITWVTDPSDLIDHNNYVTATHSGPATLTATIAYLETTDSITLTINIIEGAVPASDYGTYYDGITASSGESLVNQLQTLVTGSLGVTGNGNITYGEVRYLLTNSDLNINNSNKIWGIYDSAALPNTWGTTWDREHVWPQSRLNSSAENSRRNIASDPHNLRACTKSVNNSRGNNYFVQGSGIYKRIGEGFYPGDEHKGDVARILLYMAVRYRGILTLVDTQRGDNNTPEGANLATLSILLGWHLEDLPDQFERQRNNVIQKAQGNRNPFIDKPEYFRPVWELFMEEENLVVVANEQFEFTVQTYETLKTNYVSFNVRYTI